ncbi:MAG TPA: hypothetical protein VFK86_17370 [Bauldia sp.]|nr:hypothetical protein [Bauldia sp.]
MGQDGMMPGWPGRGYEPGASLTDMQWYMYHQHNVAFFAAFSADDIDSLSGVYLARKLIQSAPQFAQYHRAAGDPSDEDLARIVSVETVPDFAGFPELWLDDGDAVFSDPDLPLFRVRVARLAASDAEGRRAFLLVQLSHVLAEGTDSSLLTRSRSAAHAEVTAKEKAPGWIVAAARAFAWVAVPGHLLVSRFSTPHPGKIVAATRVLTRETVAAAARAYGVRQRTLLLGLTAFVISRAGTPEGKRKISSTYSVVDQAGGEHRDSFMRMRMRFAMVENRDSFPDFLRALDSRLTATEGAESGFNAEMNAAAVRLHRRLARRMPRLYAPKVFAFMPYDLVFALIPPHRLTGPLSRGLMEPVWAGAVMPGINGCVAVPGRRFVTLNFYLEESLLPRLGDLDALIAGLPVGSRSSSLGYDRDATPAPVHTPIG